jgi:glycosyltransferase involved in cell wall biosynthesis
VTIAIPTYNRAEMLRGAIASALRQTYAPLDVLVVDNASTDHTAEMVAQMRHPSLRYVRNDRNLGMVGNWNMCLRHARGEHLLLLSDDDLLEPEAVARLRAQFDNPLVVLAYTTLRYVNAALETVFITRGGPPLETGHEFIVASLKSRRLLMPSATMHPVDLARRLGGYPAVGTSADLALRLALATKGHVCCLNEPLVGYRLHDTSLSRSTTNVINSLVALVCWANGPSCPLYGYREQIRRYCSLFLYTFAVRWALRGYDEPHRVARRAAQQFYRHASFELLLRVVDQPIVRSIARVRRKLLQLEQVQ